jgi:hypothetical protein
MLSAKTLPYDHHRQIGIGQPVLFLVDFDPVEGKPECTGEFVRQPRVEDDAVFVRRFIEPVVLRMARGARRPGCGHLRLGNVEQRRRRRQP